VYSWATAVAAGAGSAPLPSEGWVWPGERASFASPGVDEVGTAGGDNPVALRLVMLPAAGRR